MAAPDSESSAPPQHFDTLASRKSPTVGPYRLCIELGSGGMARVYLARAPFGANSSFVALKIIHPHLSKDATFVEMFADEAAIASQIRHANVCSVFDFGVSDGQRYIAMEYLAGESLAAVWRKLSDASLRETGNARCAMLLAHALSGACEGLHAAHVLTDAAGEPLNIVHRDVSPENILLTYDGIAKVLDFGVASAARQHHRTRTGMLKGKIAYIAPEVLRGGRADRRADVWGIGATAWELLTGKRLFRRANDLETLRAIGEAPIPRPSELRDDLPRALDDVVLRALAREPEARYQTARELGHALLEGSATAGAVVGLGDVAEWMNELFPTGRQRNSDRLELLARVPSGWSETGDADAGRPRAADALSATAPARPPQRSKGETVSEAPTSFWPEPSASPAVRGRSGPSNGERRARSRAGFRKVAMPCAALVVGVMIGRWPADWTPSLLDAREAGSLAATAERGRSVPTRSAGTTIATPGAPLPSDSGQGPFLVRVEHEGDQLILRVERRAPPPLPSATDPGATAP